MASILEALQNANYNLNEQPIGVKSLTDPLGKDQLKNAVTLLDKGYTLDDDIDEILSEYNYDLDDIPEKE